MKTTFFSEPERNKLKENIEAGAKYGLEHAEKLYEEAEKRLRQHARELGISSEKTEQILEDFKRDLKEQGLKLYYNKVREMANNPTTDKPSNTKI